MTVPTCDDSVQQAEEIIEEINELVEQVPSRASDFAESVQERAHDIGESVREAGRATPNQLNALENMADGLRRWIR